ncbi:MAG: hypothetical protein MSA09_00620 [Lachnospiraceae bacterium]|nr:hypothetical protein [Lachnospiraceae bacterium]
MNHIERLVDAKIKRLAWKSTTLENTLSYKKMEKKINQYRWIIKDAEEQVIFDTEINGYEGLYDFPAVIEALELITSEENIKVKQRKMADKPEVIFTLESQLWSIFPYKRLEEMCIS